MTMAAMSCCAFMRRDFARSSRIERPLVSSMNIFAAASFAAAAVMAGKSRSLRKPLRMLPRLTRASEQRTRCTSCCALISREKMATALPRLIAMCSAMFMANAVFPIEGRAAMTNISAPCRPSVI